MFNQGFKFRVSFNEACELLSIGRDGLYKLMRMDNTFPRPIKDGNSKQAAVYFDWQDLANWWQAKKLGA